MSSIRHTKETQSPARQPRGRIRFPESVRVFYRGFGLIQDITFMQGRKGFLSNTHGWYRGGETIDINHWAEALVS